MGHRGQYGYIKSDRLVADWLADHRQNMRDMTDHVVRTCHDTPGAQALLALNEDIDATIRRWEALAESLDAVFDYGDQGSYKVEELKAACEAYKAPDLTVQRPYFPRVFLLKDGAEPVPWLLDFIPEVDDRVTLLDGRVYYVVRRKLDLAGKTLTLYVAEV